MVGSDSGTGGRAVAAIVATYYQMGQREREIRG